MTKIFRLSHLLPLAGYRESIAINADLELILVHARNSNLKGEILFPFNDVNLRRKRIGGSARPTNRVVEKPIYQVAKGSWSKIRPHRVITCNAHDYCCLMSEFDSPH